MPILAVMALALLAAAPAAAQESAYALATDAAIVYAAAAPEVDALAPGAAAVAALELNLLHRFDGEAWGAVLNHKLVLPDRGPVQSVVYEAYGRLDLGAWGSLFVGKRRFGLGAGSPFAPGDAVNPRTGLWDQLSGPAGAALSLSIGADLNLRAALSVERNLAAWSARAAVLAAAGTPAAAAAAAAANAALDGAAGPLDPRLLTGALAADWMAGAWQLSASAVWAPGHRLRPAAGLSWGYGALALRADAALELEDGPSPYAAAGLSWTAALGDAEAVLQLDGAYSGAADFLAKRRYLLPQLTLGRSDAFRLTARALVGLDDASALAAASLALYPAPGFDFEFAAQAALGDSGDEFALLAGVPGQSQRYAASAGVRIHF